MKGNFGIGIAAALLLVTSLSCRAEYAGNPEALARALPQASVSLDEGLKASAREGKPISGKYEIADGALQLSVYTMKGDQFREVIVDYKSGTIKKAETVTDTDDLKAAQNQSTALAKAKAPLDAAVRSAVKANGGFRAVSVIPTLEGDKPVATVTLMKGNQVKTVTEKLD